jgi:hypothetical protein
MKSTKINIYDLYRNINEIKEKKNNCYNQVLALIHDRVKKASLKEQYKVVYDVPEYIFGVPSYNLNKCLAYIMKELRNNGFLVKYYFPKILYVSWDPVEITNYKKEKKLIEKKFKTIKAAKIQPDNIQSNFIKSNTSSQSQFNNDDTPINSFYQNQTQLNGPSTTQQSTSVFKPILTYDPNTIPTYNYYAYSSLNNNLTNENFYITNDKNKNTMNNEYQRTPEHLNNINLLQNKKQKEDERNVSYQKDILDYYKDDSDEEIPFRNTIKKHNSNGKFILDLS